MKAMYRDLQKQHIKQLKTEPQRRPGGEGSKQMGFVSQCLVRVKCEGEEVVTCRRLKVCLVPLFNCLPVCSTVYLSVCSTVYLSVRLSTCLFDCLSACLYMCLCVCLSVQWSKMLSCYIICRRCVPNMER